MRFSSTQICGVVALLGVLGGCRNVPPSVASPQVDPQAVVARFSGGEIRRAEIRDAVDRRLAAVPGPVAPETRKLIVRKVIERRVRAALMAEEAKTKGYPERPEVRLQAQAAEERLLAADLVAGQLESVHAAEPLVAAAVAQRMKDSRPEEARKFSHIFLRAAEDDAAARDAARSAMQKILAELTSGTGFNALAGRYSNSITARGGGRIEWTLKKSLQPAAAEAIFALREGGLSPVIETRDGLHLFRLDGIRSPSPIDVDALRREVRKELDAEARAVAERTLRQQALDAAEVEFASTKWLDPSSLDGDEWVARFKGGEIRAREIRLVRGAASGDSARMALDLRVLVENRLLAASRRSLGLTPQLEARIASVRRDAILDAYRAALIAEIATEPTAEEIAEFYRENGASALFLRDYLLDVLFLPQSGESVADVYAAGEKVVTALREGTRFDDLLDRAPLSGARVCRDAHASDLEELGKSSLRLRKAILNLAVGDISPALYVDGPRITLESGGCVLESRGVAFLRLRELRTLPLEGARAAIRAVLEKERERAAIDAIQARLVAGSGLEILLPEG